MRALAASDAYASNRGSTTTMLGAREVPASSSRADVVEATTMIRILSLRV
jgi:hypothetical protein